MKKGWGYGKHSLSAGERLYRHSQKIIDNDQITVYQGTVIFNGFIDVKIILSKINSTKRVKMHYRGDTFQAKIFDVSHCRNKKEICKYVDDVLLEKYFYDCY